MPSLLRTLPAELTPPAEDFGDRGTVIRRRPDSTFFYRNGGRWIDITADITSLPVNPGFNASPGASAANNTAAIKACFNFFRDIINNTGHNSAHRNFPIYIPYGEFLVNDTLTWDGSITSEGDEGQNWRIFGEGRDQSIIRLANGSAGFGAGQSKAVIQTTKATNGGLPFNNIESCTSFEGFTLDVGANNPGAIGLYTVGANANVIRELTIKSTDGTKRGKYGIYFSGCSHFHVHDCTITGFDSGVFAENPHVTLQGFEYCTFQNQLAAGVDTTNAAFSLRKCLSDQSGVPAARVTGAYGFLTITDCEFRGSGTASVEIPAAGQMYARNINQVGYTNTIKRGTTFSSATEYSTSTHSLLGSTTSHTLTVEDLPDETWTVPIPAAGVGNLQALLNSGAPAVMLRTANTAAGNSISIGTIDIPATCKFLHLGYADVTGTIRLGANSPDPVVIKGAWGGPNFNRNGKTRTIAVEHVKKTNFIGGLANTKTFLTALAGLGHFSYENGKLWARWLNTEPKGTQGDTSAAFLWDGADVWIFTGKTESNITGHRCANGARLEAQGLIWNQSAFTPGSKGPNAQARMVDIVSGSASVSGIVTGIGTADYGYEQADAVKSGASTLLIPFTDLPPRHYRGANDHFAFAPLITDSNL